MALTRKALTELGIEDEAVEKIIKMHSESMAGVRDDRDKFKADLEAAQSELTTLKNGGNEWETKYNAEHKAFEDYKTAQAAKDTKAKKESAYRALLKDVGVIDKVLDKVLKTADIDAVTLDDNGAIKDAENLKKSIKDDWGDFIKSGSRTGADVENPGEGGNAITKEQFANMSYADRLKLYNESPDTYKALNERK